MPGPPPTTAMPGPPPTAAMRSWDQPPGPPPGPPSGPFPGPGPAPFPPPASSGGTSSTTLVLVALAVIALIGGLFVVVNSGDDDDKDKETSTGQLPGQDGGDLPDAPSPEDPSDDTLPSFDPEDTEPPETDVPETEPEPVSEPAEADVNDCIAVDEGGNFLGTGSCSDGGATYEVVEVVDGFDTCSDPEASYTPSGDYLLCLHVNLVETYCYQGITSWVTPADGCELPGTVHVIDIVPDVDNGDYCTTDYEWNRWYSFTAPRMVACVMEY